MTHFNRSRNRHRPSLKDRDKAKIQAYCRFMSEGLKAKSEEKQGEPSARSPAELDVDVNVIGENGNGFHDAEKDR